jgi:hypothetical protein
MKSSSTATGCRAVLGDELAEIDAVGKEDRDRLMGMAIGYSPERDRGFADSPLEGALRENSPFSVK